MEQEKNDSQKLQELLEKHSIVKITDFIELKKYFDLEELDEDSTPKITTNHNVCIIFDNIIFNETYLLDIINEIIKKHNETYVNKLEHNLEENIEFIYIDDFLIRIQLFKQDSLEWFSNNLTLSPEENHDFEKEFLQPRLITINPERNEISIFKENILMPFTFDTVKTIIDNNLI